MKKTNTNRFDFYPESVKALDIATRVALNLAVTDADRAYLASPVGMAGLSMAWSKINAVRNYHEACGTFPKVVGE